MSGADAAAGRYDLAANVSLLFAELPLLERFAAAAGAGFQSTEAWWPFPQSASPSREELEGFFSAIEESGIPLSGLNFFAGDMPAGERGVVCLPDRREEFAANVAVIAQIARRTGAGGFNALYGQVREGTSAEEHDRVAVENLALAVRTLSDVGGTVLLEPLSHGLNGAYPVETARQAVEIVGRVREATGLDNIGLLFDTFHLSNNGEDLAEVIDSHHDLIEHVQIADAPGRGEPGTGSVDVAGAISRLWDAGYRKLVACEYAPTVPTTESFGWIAGIPQLSLDRK